MAHYDIFRHHLALKFPAYGHALWDPDPGNLYPAVKIGDVGYIQEGKFHRLFNVLLPAKHPSHRNFSVPEYHEQLTLNMEDHIITGNLSPNNFCSAKVSSEPVSLHNAEGPDETPKVSFSCPKMKEGAVLYLPIQAKKESTVAKADFGKWIIKHIDRWFAWARQLGLGINRMEDIILVTGTHRTRSCTSVVFLGGPDQEHNAQASFGAKVDRRGDIVTINWEFSRESNQGPVVFNCGPDGEDLPEDQCIFIRGFRVTRKLKILPPRLKAEAGPNPDPEGYDQEPDVEPMPITAVPEYRDPLYILLEYLAEEAPPNCDVLLVHDDDLARLDHDGIYDSTPSGALQPDVVLSQIRSLNLMVHHTRIDLSSARNNASDKPESAWVATLSNIFEEQSSSRGLHAKTPFPQREISQRYATYASLSKNRSIIPLVPSAHSSMSSYKFTSDQYDAQQTGVSQQRRQSTQARPQSPALASTSPHVASRNDYPEPSAIPYQYGTHQTGAQNIPQQQRQSLSRAPLSSTSPQYSSRNDYDYPEQTAYPSYSGAPQTQPGYTSAYTGGGYLTANPTFPEPHAPPAGGSVQRSPSGRSATHYTPAGSSAAQRPSGQSATHYLPASSSAVQRSPSGQSATHYPPTSSSAVQRSPSGQSATHYSPITSNSSTQRSHAGQSTTQYPPVGSSVGQSAAYYPPAAAQAFGSTSTSYPGPQPTAHHTQAVPQGHGINTSDGPYYSNRGYAVEPAQPHREVAYEYDNGGHTNEPRPKSPGSGPVHGRPNYCRLPGCTRPVIFDRRFNEFWEWCSPHHIQAALGQRVEKVCRHCGVWPRRYGQKYCGGTGCNKNGIPLGL